MCLENTPRKVSKLCFLAMQRRECQNLSLSMLAFHCWLRDCISQGLQNFLPTEFGVWGSSDSQCSSSIAVKGCRCLWFSLCWSYSLKSTQKAQILFLTVSRICSFRQVTYFLFTQFPCLKNGYCLWKKVKRHNVHGSIYPLRSSMLMFCISITFWITPCFLMSNVVHPHGAYVTTLIRMFFNLQLMEVAESSESPYFSDKISDSLRSFRMTVRNFFTYYIGTLRTPENHLQKK